ncbi:MAG: hypothetical protein DWH91_11795 [Planctomycetota bacterium]|nr:MAG: hypothetical protein DWH91_11795 [Planctomycetota bacterium]
MRGMMMCATMVLLATMGLRADVTSGPAEGQAVPKLPVYAMFGEVTGESADMVARRGDKATIYCLIPAEKFSRPTYRLLKSLNEKLAAASPDVRIVAVWITGNQEESRSYLMRAQRSLEASLITFCVADGDANGPAEWGFNAEADITVVVVDQGKVKRSFGFVSANETVADEILKRLKSNE